MAAVSSDEHIKVVVRVRPMNSREKSKGAKCIVEMEDTTTIIRSPDDGTPKKFVFDHSYWSIDHTSPKFATQEKIFSDLGSFAIRSALGGYNISIFAYGQTGAGKTHSIIGYEGDPGIVPRLMEELFKHITSQKGGQVQFKVEAAMLEIYNDHIRDLFNPRNSAGWNLRVREHPKTGPFVEGLSWLVAKDIEEIGRMLDTGYKARTVASTEMNNESSRSHAIFQVLFTQTDYQETKGGGVTTGKKTSKMSKISLVDLAGSERYGTDSMNCVEQARMAEGKHINKSLSTLANCIYALYRAAKNPQNKQVHVPYRDSSLTWLLRESLGGNARTVMIAAISPSDICYEESLSTLRYASRAKRIQTHAVINEDINEKIIRELRAEINLLREELRSYQNASDNPKLVMSAQEIADRLNDNERMMNDLALTWDEKVQRTERIMEEQKSGPAENKYPAEQLGTMNLGISLSGLGASLNVDHKRPQLVNLNEDPLPTEFLVYFLNNGDTTVGCETRPDVQHVELTGPSIHKLHATISNRNRTVTVTPHEGAATFVNGQLITTPTILRQGNRLAFGRSHIFRFNDPEEAARIRREREMFMSSLDDTEIAPPPPVFDWEFAHKELQVAQKPGSGPGGKSKPRRRAAPPSVPAVSLTPDEIDSSTFQAPPSASEAVKAHEQTPEKRHQVPHPSPSRSPMQELGIGVLLQRNGKVTTILDLVAGGPAHGCGQLQVGQIVLEVEGKSVPDLEFQEVLGLIRGPVGTYVTLKVASPDTRTEKIVQVSRTLMQQQDGDLAVLGSHPAVSAAAHQQGNDEEEDLGSEASDDAMVPLVSHNDLVSKGVIEGEEDLGEELGEDDDQNAMVDLSSLPSTQKGEEDFGEEAGDDDEALISLEGLSVGTASTGVASGSVRSKEALLKLKECRSVFGITGGDPEEDTSNNTSGNTCHLLIRIIFAGYEDNDIVFTVESLLHLLVRSVRPKVVTVPGPTPKAFPDALPAEAILSVLRQHVASVVHISEASEVAANIVFQLVHRLEIIGALIRLSGAPGEAGSVYKITSEPSLAHTYTQVFLKHGRNALVVAESLLRRLLCCLSIVPNGDVRGTSSFDTFVQSTAELQIVDTGSLNAASVQTFFINVYNCLCLHAHATRGLSDGLDFKPSKSPFMKDAQYRIGGHNYSLEDVLNRVLRYKSSKKASRPVPEPRIHFALVDGTVSSPALAVYSVNTLSEELDAAARHYLQREVQVVLAHKCVILPRIFKWFSQDFGQNKTEVVRFVIPYLKFEDQKDVLELLRIGFKVKFKEYDWSLQLRPPKLPALERTASSNA